MGVRMLLIWDPLSVKKIYLVFYVFSYFFKRLIDNCEHLGYCIYSSVKACQYHSYWLSLKVQRKLYQDQIMLSSCGYQLHL